VANSGQQNSLVFKCVSLIEMANLLPAIREEVADAVKEAVHRRLPRQSPSQMLLHQATVNQYVSGIDMPRMRREATAINQIERPAIKIRETNWSRNS